MPRTRRAVASRTFAVLGLLLASDAAGPRVVNGQTPTRDFRYSGTISWNGSWSVSNESVRASGSEAVTATVLKNEVTCSGRWNHRRKELRLANTPDAPPEVVEEGPITGKGRLDVVTQLDGMSASSGTYQVNVSCPAAAKGADGVQVTFGSHDNPPIRNLDMLVGEETHPHENADPANGVEGTFTVRWNLRRGPSRVRAVAGGPYTVERGAAVALDGSASEGDALQYSWTFAPKGCPPGVSAKTGAKRDGPTPSVTFLCSATVTLTVTDGTNKDTQTAEVAVTPRAWKTPFKHAEQDVAADIGGRPVITSTLAANPASGDVGFTGGQNVCAHDTADHVFHPATGADSSWENTAYELRQVRDPSGPFDGYWYVANYNLSLERQTLINRYLPPGGPPPLSGTKSFYQANTDAKTDVDRYLEAISAHEGMGNPKALGHSGLMQRALARSGIDPVKRVEAMADASDKDALKRSVDAEIRKAELTICNAAKDPLPLIWSGSLAVVRIDTGEWQVRGPTSVGGTNYGRKNPCK